MRDFAQLLLFIIIGAVLLWFGYNLLIGQLSGFFQKWKNRPRRHSDTTTGSPGDPQTCPVCSSKLETGDLVQTHTFPSITGGKDRLMYIRGCIFCTSGRLKRQCPVCGSSLGTNDILVARMFERSQFRSHVHILGCSKCKRVIR
jgi:RNA polymerase subunit RPABC4/transcription elongation factor Spt4